MKDTKIKKYGRSVIFTAVLIAAVAGILVTRPAPTLGQPMTPGRVSLRAQIPTSGDVSLDVRP